MSTMKKLLPRQMEDFKRGFTYWLSKTISEKKDHHFCIMTDGKVDFSVNFTWQSINNEQPTLDKFEGGELLEKMSHGIVTPDLWDYMVKSIEFYEGEMEIATTRPEEFIMVIGKDFAVVFIAHKEPVNYEATLDGSTIQ